MTAIETRIAELKEKVKAFATGGAFTSAIQRDPSLKAEIQNLYQAVFGRTATGCSSCLADAAMEIINAKNVMEKEIIPYDLRAGALLHDLVNLDAGKMLSRKNVTIALALYHLATNPDCVKYFCRLPEDWEAQVHAYKVEHGMIPQNPTAPSTLQAAPKRKSKATSPNPSKGGE